METTQFSPKLPYLQKCIESEDVRRFLHVSRYCKPVYIITGLKIVTGARADTLRTRTVKTNLAVEVDGTVWSGGAVPVGGGPGLEGEVSSKATTEWSGGDDFVFAFRVTKVTVAKATGQVRSEEEYRKGAMLGNEEGHVEGPRLSVLISEDFDVEAEDFDTEELMEDREQVVFMTPRGREEV